MLFVLKNTRVQILCALHTFLVCSNPMRFTHVSGCVAQKHHGLLCAADLLLLLLVLVVVLEVVLALVLVLLVLVY